ncbi:MAG: FtsX-like permease family protein [Actinomycetota bacterium]
MARAVARRRWRGLVAVALLAAATVAVGGGGIAAARATITAHPRLLDRLASADASLGVGNPDEPQFGYVDPARIAALDGVAGVGVARAVLGGAVDADGYPVEPENPTGLMIPLDDRAYRDIGEVPLRAGRLPRADEADSVAISVGARDRLGAGIGGEITYAVLTMEQAHAIGAGGEVRAPEVTRLHVVGEFGPTELAGEGTDPLGQRLLIGSPALLDAHPGAGAFLWVFLQLRDGEAGVPALQQQLAALGGGGAGARADTERGIRRAVGPEAVAVLLFGLAVLVAGSLMTLQAIGRQSIALAADGPVLAALGLPRRGRAGLIGLPVALAVVAGALIGVAGGYLASPLAPIGLARAFEPDPALRLDAALLAGAGAVVVLLWGATAVQAWRYARLATGVDPARVSRPAGPLEVRLARGLAMATTETRRLTTAAVASAVMTVVTLVAVVTFSASLRRLVDTPRFYGQDFDVSVWDGYGVVDDDVITAALRATPAVAEIGRQLSARGEVGGREAGLAASDPSVVGPVVTGGRLPAGPGEVLLGRRLARSLDLTAGDSVRVASGERSRNYDVVGTGVLPDGGADAALLTAEGLRRVAPDAEVGFQYARLEPGADAGQARSEVLDALGLCSIDCDVRAPSPPADVQHLDRVGNLPALLAAVLAVLGVAGTTHAVVLVTRSGRRSLALLRAVGGTSGLLLRTVLAQVLLIGVTAIVVGLPLGWVAGRILWARFADALGVVPGAAVPAAATAGLVTVLLVAALALALGPAWREARVAAGPNLRAD